VSRAAAEFEAFALQLRRAGGQALPPRGSGPSLSQNPVAPEEAPEQRPFIDGSVPDRAPGWRGVFRSVTHCLGALAPKFLHSSPDSREIVGCTRARHVSLP
jgi:hypothetical protein